jgi:osmoprotectant transport system permease protein
VIVALARLLTFALLPALVQAQPALDVGSKRFTESYILAEVIARTVNGAGEARARHQAGLGNTAIVFAALKSGTIHLYPEYTGTIALELLGLAAVPPLTELNRALEAHGLAAGISLGFSNSYALAMREDQARFHRSSSTAATGGGRCGSLTAFLSTRADWITDSRSRPSRRVTST